VRSARLATDLPFILIPIYPNLLESALYIFRTESNKDEFLFQ